METGAVLSKEATKATPNRLARGFVVKVHVTSLVPAVDACRPQTDWIKLAWSTTGEKLNFLCQVCVPDKVMYQTFNSCFSCWPPF